MVPTTIWSSLLFGCVALGLAWPLARRLGATAPEKIGATLALSLLGVFLFAWLVYVSGAPTMLLWLLPVLAVLGLIFGRSAWREILSDPEARDLLVGQALVSAWCVGLLALVLSYSGGGWTGDWFGHWDRSKFFLERGPHDILFSGFDPVPSRPPLANVIVGAFLGMTHVDFAQYQLVSTLFSSLAFAPAALLAHRFGGSRAVRGLVVLTLVSPLFAQNATFSWTKLPTAFFTLMAVYFFLRAHDPEPPARAALLLASCLAAALLAHYSAGPYAIALALAWFGLGWRQLGERRWWRQTFAAAAAGTAVLVCWFGWALAVYGAGGTFLTNTSVTDKAPTASAQLVVMALNIRDTIVPHFLRTVDQGFLAQPSPWGWVRDWFFQLYQVNLLFMFGSIAWIAIIAALVAAARSAAPERQIFWAAFVTLTTVLGIIVHGARDTWGLAHICLQPLALLGLAFLAAHWHRLHRRLQQALVAGATADFALGLVLQFAVQNYALDRWLTPGQPLVETLFSYSEFASMNVRAKLQSGWQFFGEGFAPHSAIVALLGALLLLALVRARGRVAPVEPPVTTATVEV